MDDIKFTMEPVSKTRPAVNHALKPEFLRMPPARQRCPITGLTRSYLYNLVLPSPANEYKPPVESRVLRQRGKIKGVRLIVYESLISYLNTQGESTETRVAN